MKIDYDYLKAVLDFAQSSPTPSFNISDQMPHLWHKENTRSPDDEKLGKLIFHLELLADDRLIESVHNTTHGIGFGLTGDGQYVLSVIPLRLTSAGHDFIASLNREGVLEQMKSEFNNAGPGEIVKIAFSLGSKVLENKLQKLLGE